MQQRILQRQVAIRTVSMSSSEHDFNDVARRWSDLFRCTVDGPVSSVDETKVTQLIVLLKQCCKTGCLEDGKRLHAKAVATGCHTDKYVATALINMYSRFRSLAQARSIFAQTFHRDVITWTSLITACVDNGESAPALDLFTAMDCEPNHFTYVAILKACARLAVENREEKDLWLQKGMELHKRVEKSLVDRDTVLENALVDMYSKCGSMVNARHVFDRMVQRDVVSWTCIIQGYVENKQSLVALDLFASIDCDPDSVTLVAALKACSSLAGEKGTWKWKHFCLHKGMSIHKLAVDGGCDSNLSVASSLLDMYCKCGSMDSAWDVFSKMSKRDLLTWNSLILGLADCEGTMAKQAFDRVPQRNVVTWTGLMLGHVNNGQSSDALSLFLRMDCEPDCVTFVAALRACSSLGAISIGKAIHAWICRVGLEQGEGTASSLVDFYGKCGVMVCAELVFGYLQCPSTASWNALIAGYSMLGDTSQVFNLADKLQLGSEGRQMDGITFLCVLRTCSHAGLVDVGKRYFELMFRCGVTPGVEHYTCMADIFGRASRLDEAMSLVNRMPYPSDTVTWMALLGACTIK